MTRVSIVFITLAAAFSMAQTRSAKTLDIYLVDVEGGNATPSYHLPVSRCSLIRETGVQPPLETLIASWPP